MSAIHFKQAMHAATAAESAEGQKISPTENSALLKAAVKDFDAIAPGAVVLGGKFNTSFRLVADKVPDTKTVDHIEQTIGVMLDQVPSRTTGEWIKDIGAESGWGSYPQQLKRTLNDLRQALRDLKKSSKPAKRGK
jgi:hypothetical protein